METGVGHVQRDCGPLTLLLVETLRVLGHPFLPPQPRAVMYYQRLVKSQVMPVSVRTVLFGKVLYISYQLYVFWRATEQKRLFFLIHLDTLLNFSNDFPVLGGEGTQSYMFNRSR